MINYHEFIIETGFIDIQSMIVYARINLWDCTNILLAACRLASWASWVQLPGNLLHHPNTAILFREHGTGQSRDRDFNQFGPAHFRGCIGAWHPLVQWPTQRA